MTSHTPDVSDASLPSDLVDSVLRLHLLINQCLYCYKESGEKCIIQMFLLMKEFSKDWVTCNTSNKACSHSKGYKVMSLLSQDYIWCLMQAIINIPFMHYIHSNLFSIMSLMADLLSPHGGVCLFFAPSLSSFRLVIAVPYSFSQPSSSILNAISPCFPH